jgi:NAD(P)-dependent dehydrogenase (short-subunit alcohol dehydrogenase family)
MVTVITGATRGIGREIALNFGRAGAKVVIVGRTTEEAPNPFLPGTLQSVRAELHANGIEARSVQADLLDEDQTRAIVDHTLGWYGRCDVLVNNAAYTSNGPILQVPWGRWQKGMRVQVAAPLQLVQGFVPGMLERGVGRVVNISSGAAANLSPGLSLYGVTKLSMERLTQYLHAELGGRGVSFNAMHIDRAVSTETWHLVVDRQGAELGLTSETRELMAPAVLARQVEWMVRQPADWSGHVIGLDEIEAQGGPRDAG